MPHAEVTFLRGRIKFDGLTTNLREDSMIAVFGDHPRRVTPAQGQETRPALPPDTAAALRQEIAHVCRAIDENVRLQASERYVRYTLDIVRKLVDHLSASAQQPTP